MKVQYLSKNLSFEQIKNTLKLTDDFCYSLLDHGFYIYKNVDDWFVVGNNDFGGWKTTIPQYFLGGG